MFASPMSEIFLQLWSPFFEGKISAVSTSQLGSQLSSTDLINIQLSAWLFLGQRINWVTVSEQLEHGKDGAWHVARISGTLKGLPGSGLLSAPAA
jgi:hypothetical protein